MRRVLALLTLALLTGCSHRERANPFDPRNPSTHGGPIGFVALAGNEVVTLQWQPNFSQELLRYRLFRSIADDPEFHPFADVPTTQTRIFDTGLINGVEYRYRLFFVLSSGVAGTPGEDAAVPGPLHPWVVDASTHDLIGITADGRHAASHDRAFVRPTHVAADPVTGIVWVSDPEGAQVVIANPSSGFRRIIRDVLHPVALAVDPNTHDAWVCDDQLQQVLHFDDAGDPVEPVSLGSFGAPIGVSVNPRTGTVWVCDNQANRVHAFSGAGAALWSLDVARPSRVAVDSSNGEAWVTSFTQGQVVRVAVGVSPTVVGGFQGPIGIAVDHRRGRIWVADAAAGQVVALRRSDSSVEFRVEGLPEVRDLAVDLATGECWAVVPGTGRLAMVSSAGDLRGSLGGFQEPSGIALDPGSSVRLTAPDGVAPTRRPVTLSNDRHLSRHARPALGQAHHVDSRRKPGSEGHARPMRPRAPVADLE